MSNTVKKQDNIYKQIRKTFLWVAVALLIIELVIEAILILTGASSNWIVKIQITFLLMSVFFFVGVNNLIRIEKGAKSVQSLAWTSLISNLVWLLLAVVVIWCEIGEMPIVRIILVALSLGVGGFLISNVLSIRETVKPVKPLKITAVVCAAYCSAFVIVIALIGFENILSNPDIMRWIQLSSLAEFAFVVTALAALIVSRTNQSSEVKDVSEKDNKEMQLSIQEMVEKEVQERLRLEREKAARDAMPPLQSEDMPPEVSRDNEVKLENTVNDRTQIESDGFDSFSGPNKTEETLASGASESSTNVPESPKPQA